MIEGQNKSQMTVLTLEATDGSDLISFFRENPRRYPLRRVHTRSSSVADPSLSPIVRGQRHRTRVWGRTGERRRKEGVVVSVVRLGGRGERERRKNKGTESKRNYDWRYLNEA
jgi:hypothetical protein